MIIKRNKKGAVELSLNLIIMLIIGMVVLGLVIGFVNSLVSKGAANFDKQLGENEKLKLDKIKSCPDNLCVEPSPSLTMKLGGKTNVFIKARAYDSTTPIACGPGILNACQITANIVDNLGADANSNFAFSGPGISAADGSTDAKMYTLITGTTPPALGTYYLTIQLYSGTSKTLTLNVE